MDGEPSVGHPVARLRASPRRKSVVPFVEGKYSTYAASTSEADLRASRMHRAYGGFSMGAVSTWAVFQNNLDLSPAGWSDEEMSNTNNTFNSSIS